MRHVDPSEAAKYLAKSEEFLGNGHTRGAQ